MTTLKISYTINGKTRKFVENGKTFQGCLDRNNKVEIEFKRPITARAIRLHPTTWHGAIALRFEAVVIYGTN